MTERVGRGKMLERTNYKMTNRQERESYCLLLDLSGVLE